MISNLALIDNPKVRELGTKMMDLPHVVDIRFFPTLKEDLKELAGAGVVTFQAVTLNNGQYRHVFILAPEKVYSEEENHQALVDQLAVKIAACWKEEPPQASQTIITDVIIPSAPIEEPITEAPKPTEE